MLAIWLPLFPPNHGNISTSSCLARPLTEPEQPQIKPEVHDNPLNSALPQLGFLRANKHHPRSLQLGSVPCASSTAELQLQPSDGHSGRRKEGSKRDRLTEPQASLS